MELITAFWKMFTNNLICFTVGVCFLTVNHVMKIIKIGGAHFKFLFLRLKKVTMEEQMICGALELLNEEAKEDALKGEESPTSTLSPINSEAGKEI